MATKKKAASRPKAKTTGEGFELFKIETGVPLPVRGERDPDFKPKLIDAAKKLKVEQSFVIFKSKLHKARQILKAEIPEFVFVFSLITPEKKFARIHRKQ